MPLDPRRVAPPAVAALVVGALVATLFVHRDAEPLPDPTADRERARREAVDLYATSGEDKRLTGESDPTPAALPPGHPTPAPLPDGHPPIDAPPKAPTASPARVAAPDLPFAVTVPASWTPQTPSSSMRSAQWGLAPEAGGDPGQVYVFTGIGGSVAANVERWEKEFGGAKAATKEFSVESIRVTRVAIDGTFSGGMAAMGSGAPREGWRLLGAVVETPSGMVFVKGTGPAAVMDREERAFDEFLASIAPRR